MRSMGIDIKAHHAGSRIFRAHKWIKARVERKQRLTFPGVNAHHQNGVVER